MYLIVIVDQEIERNETHKKSRQKPHRIIEASDLYQEIQRIDKDAMMALRIGRVDVSGDDDQHSENEPGNHQLPELAFQECFEIGPVMIGIAGKKQKAIEEKRFIEFRQKMIVGFQMMDDDENDTEAFCDIDPMNSIFDLIHNSNYNKSSWQLFNGLRERDYGCN